jgi:hypothetical protein
MPTRVAGRSGWLARRKPVGVLLILAIASAVVVTSAVTAPGGSLPATAAAPSPGLLVGLTHTQFSADTGGNKKAVTRARSLLTHLDLENQFIMGFGVNNPEPSPGVYHWHTLDERVGLMHASGHPVVLTLCGAPDWMKGGTAGHTNWSQINVAPLPAHYKDFAKLAAKIARRYPFVHYFQVWSELRGFYDHTTNYWDMPAYTKFYNDVYRALKRVNPKIKVGGPYVNMTSWTSSKAGGRPSTLQGPWGIMDNRSLEAISYWLAHAAGADFISVDGGPDASDSDPPLSSYPTALGKLTAADQWIRQQTSLPIWWSEVKLPSRTFYGGMKPSATATVDVLRTLADSGARVGLLWCGERCSLSGDGGRGLWSSTTSGTGGIPTVIYHTVVQALPSLRDHWAVP